MRWEPFLFTRPARTPGLHKGPLTSSDEPAGPPQGYAPQPAPPCLWQRCGVERRLLVE